MAGYEERKTARCDPRGGKADESVENKEDGTDQRLIDETILNHDLVVLLFTECLVHKVTIESLFVLDLPLRKMLTSNTFKDSGKSSAVVPFR